MNNSFATMRIFKYYVFLFGCLVLASSSVLAEWQRLGDKQPNGPEFFMDPQSIKQAGPMAIFRQVRVLKQGPSRLAPTAASTTTLYEYNCISSQVRVLQVLGFDKPWAAGDKLELSVSSSAVAQWHISTEPVLAQPMADMLCPGGSDFATKKAD